MHQSAKLGVLHALAPMRLTHHWYAPYAPLPSSIDALRAFVLSCYKYRCACRPHGQPWTHVKMRIFSFRWETHLFWANLAQKIKIVSLSWNLVPMLIWICKIQRGCSLFPFSTVNIFFWANFVQKIKIVSLNWTLVPRLIRICTIQWWCWLFLF